MGTQPQMTYLQLYNRLYDTYGPQHWWPGDTALEISIGAILTQSTAWRNVEKAIAQLKQHACLSTQALLEIPREQLEALIRPCGYYRAKAQKLWLFLTHLQTHHSGDIPHLLAQSLNLARRELLSIWGIGPETADSILLYAGGHPTFVVDAYTHRLLERLGRWPGRYDYAGIQRMFMEQLPPDPDLYNEYHALIVRHGGERCRKAPRCDSCPLRQDCLLDQGALR